MARKPRAQTPPAPPPVEGAGDQQALVPPGPEGLVLAPSAVPIVGEVPKGRILQVSGPQGGRRRAGFRFGPAPVRIPEEFFSAEALAALRSDPLLSVIEIEAG